MVSSIPNYLQEFFCSFVLFLILGRVRRERAVWFWGAFFVWPVVSLTMNLGYWDRLNVWGGADLVQVVRMMFLILFITVGGLGYEGGWVRVLYSVLVSDVLMSTLTIATAGMYALLRGIPFGTVLQDPGVICSMPMILFKLAVFLILIRACCRPIMWIRDFPFERFPLLKVIALLVMLCMVNPAVYQMSIPEKRAGRSLIALLYVSIAVFTTLAIILYVRAESIRQQNIILHRQIQLTQEYQGILNEQHEAARKLRHDIRRHIRTLTWAAEDSTQEPQIREKLLAYRGRLEEMAGELQMGDYTGDPDVDAMFYAVEQYCREHRIPWECRLRQMDFSIIPEDIRRDTAFYMSYWAIRFLQKMVSGTGEYSAGLKKDDTEEKCRLQISGGSVGGRSLMQMKICGTAAREDPEPSITEQLRNVFGKAGMDGDVLVSAEDNSICLDISWADTEEE